MKIGLVRHFKVDCPHKMMMTSEEFRDWSEKYEHARILKKKVNMSGINWDVCYCSDLERAVETAKEVYSGNIYIDMPGFLNPRASRRISKEPEGESAVFFVRLTGRKIMC